MIELMDDSIKLRTLLKLEKNYYLSLDDQWELRNLLQNQKNQERLQSWKIRYKIGAIPVDSHQ